MILVRHAKYHVHFCVLITAFFVVANAFFKRKFTMLISLISDKKVSIQAQRKKVMNICSWSNVDSMVGLLTF